VSVADREGFAVLTTPQLRLDLREVEHIIGMLRRASALSTVEREDLEWLQSRRRFILAMLAMRRAQNANKVVRLEVWRGAGVALPEHLPEVA
jgi:hypothetical protein